MRAEQITLNPPPPPPEKRIVLTMTLAEASLLYKVSGRNVTIPAAVVECYGVTAVTHEEVRVVLAALQMAFFNAGVRV